MASASALAIASDSVRRHVSTVTFCSPSPQAPDTGVNVMYGSSALSGTTCAA